MGGLITNIWHNYYSFSMYGKGKYAAYFPGSPFSMYETSMKNLITHKEMIIMRVPSDLNKKLSTDEIFAYFLGISHNKFLYLSTNYYPTGFT